MRLLLKLDIEIVLPVSEVSRPGPEPVPQRQSA